MSFSLTRKVLVLKPYDLRLESVSGAVLHIKRATGPFEVRFPGGEFIPGVQGCKFTSKDKFFLNVQFHNPSDSPIEIIYYCGSDGVDFFPDSTAKDAETYTIGSGILNLQGGVVDLHFVGSDNGNPRRQITVQNLDDTTPVNLFSSDHKVCAQVPPGQSWTMMTSGFIGVANSSGSGASVVQCLVLETFYMP